jgi:hypothetical protein
MKKSLTLVSFALLALASAAASAAQPAGQRDAVDATPAARSTLTRQAVENEVLEARARGELVAAGEGVESQGLQSNGVSTLTRAQVRADVLAARAAGELTPAGEGANVQPYGYRRPVPAYVAGRNSTASKIGG